MSLSTNINEVMRPKYVTPSRQIVEEHYGEEAILRLS